MRKYAFLCSVIVLFSSSLGRAEGETPPDYPTSDGVKAPLAHPVVSLNYGDMTIGLGLQVGFDILPNQVEGSRNSFGVQRARFGVRGHFLNRNLEYDVLLDGLGASPRILRPGGLGSETLVGEGGSPAAFILDARLTWVVPLIGARFSVGRFIPSWGLSMPAVDQERVALHYPLYVHGARGSLGHFRKVGVEAEFSIAKQVDFGGGVFNSGRNSWRDESDRKDVLAYLTIRPMPGLTLRASSLFAFEKETEILSGDDGGSESVTRDETHILPILEIRYSRFAIDAMLGGAMGIVFSDDGEDDRDHHAYGAMGQLAVDLAGDWFVFFGRVEWWEPNDRQPDDEQWRITVGPSFPFEGIHGRISVHYVQDIHSSRSGMCTSYLQLAACESNLEEVDEASRYASAILFSFGMDI